MTTATLRLSANAEAVHEARRALRQACRELPSDVIDDVLLLSSELVTNAVRYAGGILTIVVESDGRQVAVAVGDSNPELPVVRPGGLESTTGRGLQLVNHVASGWGTRPSQDGTGKVVWFRVTA